MGDYEDQSVAPTTSCTFASTERREGTLLFGKNNDRCFDGLSQERQRYLVFGSLENRN